MVGTVEVFIRGDSLVARGALWAGRSLIRPRVENRVRSNLEDGGAEMGDRYVERTRREAEHAENALVRMRPERWLTVDYAKEDRS